MTMLEEALAYAALGWPVFPCHPNDKQPLVPKSSAPGANDGGLYLATTDAEQIRRWWRRSPDAMIGVRTGPSIGAFVVDLDPGVVDAEAGEVMSAEDLAAAIEKLIGEPLPPTRTSLTPRGGQHRLFRWIPPEDLDGAKLGNSPGALPRFGEAHCDVRGEGGYICVAPSVRRGPKAREEGCDGVAYRWVDADAPIADAPAALIDCILRRGRFARSHTPPTRPSVGDRVDAAVASLHAPLGRGGVEDPEAVAVRRYALSALDAEVAVVTRAAKGGRGAALNAAAFALGQLVAADVLSESVVVASLEDAAVRNGNAADERWPKIQATLQSGLRAGMAKPRDLSEIARKARDRSNRASGSLQPFDDVAGPEAYGLPPAAPPGDDAGASSSPAPSPPEASKASLPNGRNSGGGRSAEPPPEGGEGGIGDVGDHDEELDQRLAFLPLTDLGNAERFVQRFGGSFMWCPALGWFYWDGRRWAREGADGRVAIAANRTARLIQAEADALAESDQDRRVNPDDPKSKWLSDVVAKWGRTSESAGHLLAIGKLAAAYVEVATAELDANPWLINVMNGTLEVRSGAGDGDPISFRDHDPRDRITKLAAVVYDPAAPSPIYDDFLAYVQPKAEDRRFLHQWGGLSLTGDTSEQKLAFFYGKGKNGKSTLVDAWGLIAGDYGETVGIETFLDQGRARGAGQATPDLALLPGVRMLRTSEPEKGAKLAESLIKLVTGGEPIQARHLNRDFFKFYPAFKLTLSGNYRPQVVGTDDGIWRRVMLVPWGVTVPEERRDKQLGEKLKGEGAGILNRLLDGLRDWLDHGLITPEAVTEATEEYRSDSDPLGRFLAVCVEARPDSRVQSSELHKVYQAWAAASGERPWSPQYFGRAVKEKGLRSKQSNVIWWLDIALLKHVEDFVDADGKPFDQDSGGARAASTRAAPDYGDLPPGERWP